jgi:hypothetical protein
MGKATPYFESVSAQSINVLGRAIGIAWDIAKGWSPIAARLQVYGTIQVAVFEMARAGERDPHRMAFVAVGKARTAVAKHLAITGARRISEWRTVFTAS